MERGENNILLNALNIGLTEMQNNFIKAFVNQFQNDLEVVLKKYNLPEALRTELINLGLRYEASYRYR